VEWKATYNQKGTFLSKYITLHYRLITTEVTSFVVQQLLICRFIKLKSGPHEVDPVPGSDCLSKQETGNEISNNFNKWLL